jgi:hypothetical protein
MTYKAIEDSAKAADTHLKMLRESLAEKTAKDEPEMPEYERSFLRTFGLDQMTPEEFEDYLASK